jgi:hypothetical protein
MDRFYPAGLHRSQLFPDEVNQISLATIQT